MVDTNPTTRTWFVKLVPDEAQVRCSYQRLGKRILRFTVQLEIKHSDE